MYEISLPIALPNRRFIVDAASYGLACEKLCDHLRRTELKYFPQLDGTCCKLVRTLTRDASGIHSYAK